MNKYGNSLGAVVLSLAAIILGIGAVASIVLGIFWCIWQLWMFTIPQLFTQAPEGFKYPGYWLFVSCVVLFNWMKFTIFGSRTYTKDKNASKD